ncbi:MAG: hypothetical protein QM770_04645 [Tepidisphaeraceae bacterium]
MRLQGALSFLADLLSTFVDSDEGFSFAMTPRSARSTLSLPLPDIQAGAFGMANLNLGCWFEVGFGAGEKGGFDFTMTTGLRVGRREAPFTLIIFILGGAGWFETEVTYSPTSGKFLARVSIAIFASAGLGVALGPVRGSVFAYFGINADFLAKSNEGTQLSVAIVIIFRGEVSLLGFITVSLCLTLEARYQSGGGLTGTGTVSYKIKIGWFFKIEVNASVSYSFGKSSGQSGSGGSAKALCASRAPMLLEQTDPVELRLAAARQFEEMFA